jgi:hypothetical protein
MDDGGQQEITVQGAIIPLNEEVGGDVIEQAERAAPPDIDVPDSAALMDTGDGLYLIAVEEGVSTGHATIRGVEVAQTESANILIAESVVSFTTQGIPASTGDFDEVVSQNNGDIVRVEMDPFSQGAISGDFEGQATYQAAVGVETPITDDLQMPGKFAANKLRDGLPDQSGDEIQSVPSSAENVLYQSLGVRSGTPNAVALYDRRFWATSPATVDIAIVDGRPYIAAINFDGVQELDSVAAVADVPTGSLVQLEADVIESRISAKETLVRTLPCGSDLFTVGPACLPAVADVVVHGGALYDSPAEEDMVPIAGVSSVIQNQPIQSNLGAVEVVGEVVSTQAIDPNLPEQKAIIVYKMEDEGDNTRELSSAAFEFRDEIRDRLESQLIAAADKDQQVGASEQDGEGPGGNGGEQGGDDSQDSGGNGNEGDRDDPAQDEGGESNNVGGSQQTPTEEASDSTEDDGGALAFVSSGSLTAIVLVLLLVGVVAASAAETFGDLSTPSLSAGLSGTDVLASAGILLVMVGVFSGIQDGSLVLTAFGSFGIPIGGVLIVYSAVISARRKGGASGTDGVVLATGIAAIFVGVGISASQFGTFVIPSGFVSGMGLSMFCVGLLVEGLRRVKQRQGTSVTTDAVLTHTTLGLGAFLAIPVILTAAIPTGVVVVGCFGAAGLCALAGVLYPFV